MDDATIVFKIQRLACFRCCQYLLLVVVKEFPDSLPFWNQVLILLQDIVQEFLKQELGVLIAEDFFLCIIIPDSIQVQKVLGEAETIFLLLPAWNLHLLGSRTCGALVEDFLQRLHKPCHRLIAGTGIDEHEGVACNIICLLVCWLGLGLFLGQGILLGSIVGSHFGVVNHCANRVGVNYFLTVYSRVIGFLLFSHIYFLYIAILS